MHIPTSIITEKEDMNLRESKRSTQTGTARGRKGMGRSDRIIISKI